MNAVMRLGIAGHVKLYRATNGSKGAVVQGMPVLLLSTKGRKTGKERTAPLVYIEEGEGWVIAASAAGADKHPAWFLNLRDAPRVTVQIGAEIFQADCMIHAEGDRRDELYADLSAKGPFFKGYQEKTSRVIPIIELRRVG